MNSNKGFAVSTVLYALLIVFLMFTLVLIASYNASSDVLSSATSDLTENNSFTVRQVKPAGNVCGKNGWDWYKTNIILQVKAPQGTFYWPKDWYNYDSEKGLVGDQISSDYTYNGLKAECLLENGEYGSCKGLALANVTNFLPYDNSATKGFKPDELMYIYNLLSEINTSLKTIGALSPKDNYPDVIFDENLNQYYCKVSALEIKCIDDDVEHTYIIAGTKYNDFKEKYKPKYKCFKKAQTDSNSVKYCDYNPILKKCINTDKSYDTAVECTTKITPLVNSTDASFLYGINESGKELIGNKFIYVSNNTTNDYHVNFDQKEEFNFFVNPTANGNYTYIYKNENNENYFNVSKLKETLDYGRFFVRFSNQLDNDNSLEIRLYNFCSD